MLPLVQHKVFTNFPFDIFEAKVSINMRAFPGKRRVQLPNGEVETENCNIKQELLLSVQDERHLVVVRKEKKNTRASRNEFNLTGFQMITNSPRVTLLASSVKKGAYTKYEVAFYLESGWGHRFVSGFLPLFLGVVLATFNVVAEGDTA